MNFLAFDLGATSGRAILGKVEDGRLSSEEVYRFPNAVKEIDGKYFWDIYALLDIGVEIKGSVLSVFLGL